MAWLYVPDLEGLSEGLNPLLMATEPFAMSKGKPIPRRSWPLRWKKDKFLKHLYGLMCEPSKANDGVEKWISSVEVSHANHIPRQGNNLPTKTQETYGPISLESLARFDHESSSWKTCQMSLSGHYLPYSKTFPKWGMMQHGVLSQLPTLARHIKEKGGSYWPTPTVAHLRNHNEPPENYDKRVQEWKDGKTKGKPGISLGVAVKKAEMFPTPTTQAIMLCESMNHSKAHRNLRRHFATPTATDSANMPMRTVAKESLKKGLWRGIDLKTSALMIPTPNAADGMRTNTVHQGGNLTLKGFAEKFPTPQASEGNKITGLENQMTLTKMGRQGSLGDGGKLNPQWVEWLMGWPIGFTELEDAVME